MIDPRQDTIREVNPAQLLYLLWGDELQVSDHELERAQVSSIEEVLGRYAYVRWIKLPWVDLCSFTLRGVAGDEEVYKFKTLKRLIPRTYIVPWDRVGRRFDHAQAITGLTKIAGMQDEGVHQILNIDEINTRCVKGETISIEKANGKACVFWVKRWSSKWILGFGSKTSVDPALCYEVTAPLDGSVTWSNWVAERLDELGQVEALEAIAEFRKPKEADHRERNEIIEKIARYTLQRLSRMDEVQIVSLIAYLQGGATLCGELEEGGRHIVPTLKRVVYFVASRFTPSGITLDSPIDVAELLNDLGMQSHGELAFTREPFKALSGQPRSLRLTSSLIEGSVRYFLDENGDVVATMKIKDPHYMFYRKLRNSMGSSAKTTLEVLRRLMRATRDQYYQKCLQKAGIPTDFSHVMIRSAASFLYWFTQQDDLGQQFKLAGFMPHQIGLGALMNRWRLASGEPHLGDYAHVIAHPEHYQIPAEWAQRAPGFERVAMLSLHGAQGSGKTTLALALCQAFNHASINPIQTALATDKVQGERVNTATLALPAEQDPLQRKRDYLSWLELAILPEIKAWLNARQVIIGEDVPSALLEPLAWRVVGSGKPSVKFVKLLDGLYRTYIEGLKYIHQSHGHDGELSVEQIMSAPPLVIVNARCNQNQQSTQRWDRWLGERAYAGLVTARLNAPVELLNQRVSARGRQGDDKLLGEVIHLTHHQVTRCTGIDAELNATLTTDELVSECLPLLELAQSRVHEQWRFNLQG